MKVVILCGGEGTRLKDASETLPKPLVPIGEKPILWHIMKYYAAAGFKKFILCLGYKSELFVDYFLNYRARQCDLTLTLKKDGPITFHQQHEEDNWEVTLAHAGLNTMTGGRLWRVAKYITGEDFHLTYGDGLSTIDLKKLTAFHQSHGALATVSAVHPSGRFGEMELRGPAITQFHEKGQTHVGYINGGFMVLKKAFIEQYLKNDPTLALEQAPLSQSAKDGNLKAFIHDGFWQCMDTPREFRALNQLWESGKAPWKCW